jgi:hypothetical protein
MSRFDPAGQALTSILEQYTDAQLELILEFTERNNEAIRRLWQDGALGPRPLPA